VSTEVHRCQVLVIGSGPGGSVTAWTLAAKGKDVLLVEEGPNLPLGSCPPFSIEELRQKYRSGGMNPALGKPTIPFVEARCAGGGSEINSGMYHRIPIEVLGVWRKKFQAQHLEMEHLLPHFEACESALCVQLNPGKPPGAATKMRTGADAMGWKSKEIPRWFKYEKEPLDSKDHSGRRQSMTETLIPRAMAFGCRFMTSVRAEQLRPKNKHWELKAERAGVPISIFADAVFLCCGALQSPALLRRSGIRKNIGNSLALHPTIKVVAFFPDEINAGCADVAPQQVTEFAPRVCMGCSISTLPYISLAMSSHRKAKPDACRDWRRAAIYYAMIMGPNTGTVRNVPFAKDPLVRYSLGKNHFELLGTSLRDLCRLLFAAGATELYPGIAGCSPLKTEGDLRHIPPILPPDSTDLMTIHLFSSCVMGEARDICAVDSFGKVHGHQNLFVNDASLLCTAPGVNPQGSIMAIARRNALHFANGL